MGWGARRGFRKYLSLSESWKDSIGCSATLGITTVQIEILGAKFQILDPRCAPHYFSGPRCAPHYLSGPSQNLLGAKNQFSKFRRVTIRGAQPSARLSEEIGLSEGSAGVSERAPRGLSEGSAGSLRGSGGVRGIFRGFSMLLTLGNC